MMDAGQRSMNVGAGARSMGSMSMGGNIGKTAAELRLEREQEQRGRSVGSQRSQRSQRSARAGGNRRAADLDMDVDVDVDMGNVDVGGLNRDGRRRSRSRRQRGSGGGGAGDDDEDDAASMFGTKRR